MADRSDLSAEISEVVTNLPDTGKRATRAEQHQARRITAVQLSLSGMTYAQIGDHLQITENAARDMVRRSLEYAENRQADEMRAIENARLDRMQVAIWRDAIQGDGDQIDRVLRIMSHRAKINGLYAATKLDVNLSFRQEAEQALAALETMVLEGEVISEHDGHGDAEDDDDSDF